ncbi:MAG TPA: imidazoleglycerol-phosphate dehydratase [Fimbriimonadales bacterium]|jgi:imidazoleglycerol-phosphate dehydratase|nr:imidazoleglycerol-phosphate dehydratase [Fimbriimonadales bacterium]
MSKEAPGVRYAEVELETEENRVRVVLDLDGERQATTTTGVGYFDHMLSTFAYHGCFDLGVTAERDYVIDDLHILEDVGACLGRAIRQAIGDGGGIVGYGSEHAPMDEALAHAVVDLSGRSYLNFEAEFSVDKIGEMSTENVEQFFHAVARGANMTLHIRQLAGHNNHHVCEAIFRAFGRSLFHAVTKIGQSSRQR